MPRQGGLASLIFSGYRERDVIDVEISIFLPYSQ